MMNICKKLMNFILAVLIVISSFNISPATVSAETTTPADAIWLAAPTKNLGIHFWLDENGAPYYNVFLNGKALVENSALGFSSTIGDFKSGFEISNVTESSANETWSPVVGEKSIIIDHYNQKSIELTHTSGKKITIEMRAYDTGVAFRYILPQETSDYTINKEYTQFVFPQGTVAYAHAYNNQTIPMRIPVEEFANYSQHYQRPMTLLYPDGAAMTIAEANLDNYCVMTLIRDTSTPRALIARMFSNVVVSENSPSATPWRVFVIGETLAKLPENSDIILNLNDPADEETYKFSEWVKAGKNIMLGAGKETTETLKSWIDTAKEENFQYVLLDYGWYGPELDNRCDPRLDPTKLEPDDGDSPELAAAKQLMKQYIVGDGHFKHTVGFPPYGKIDEVDPNGFAPDLDMKAVCEYANSQGIGMILYVNDRHLFDTFGRYTVDELFARFKEWGAAGVKPGFVQCRDQKYEKRLREMIEAAAKYQLVLTIHDEYVTTGIERTYPNCLTTEGILGDEGIGREGNPQVAEDISALFTRPIQGPTDHTFCYPGKATKTYALASSLLFRTGLQSLYWYGNPNSVRRINVEEKQFWRDMPATWDDLIVLEASMAEYATYARRSNEDWYVGSVSAIERELNIPLTFLTEGKQYVAEIYADEIGLDAYSSNKNDRPMERMSFLVDSNTILNRPMRYGTGFAVRIRPATENDSDLPVYNNGIERLKNVIEEIKLLKPEDYTISTWEAVAQALSYAEDLLKEGANPSPEQLQEAAENLKAAKANLLSVTVLTEQLNKTKCLVERHYTPESWAPLATAVAEGKALLEQTGVTQADIDNAAEAIKNALRQLVQKDLEPAEVIYLSDLEYEPYSTTAWGSIQKDRSYENTKIELIVDGVRTVFPKGLGAHADSDIYFNIEGKGYEIFEAYVGVDAIKPVQGNIIFRVYSDDVLIYESKPSGTGSSNAQKISVPIANTKILRLQADKYGSDNGDHADWADAKFLIMKEVDSNNLKGISINGKPIQEFRVGRYDYYYPIKKGDPVPQVTVEVPNDLVQYQIIEPKRVPGTTEIIVTRPDNTQVTYKIHFRTATVTYLSDIDWDKLDKLGSQYGNAAKDNGFEGNPMLVTGPDGEAMEFPEVNGKRKGIGMHADCAVTYDIEGKGYGRFEAWVGASHTKEYNNSMVFRVFFDDETEPRYESPVMHYRKPAEFVSLDLMGVKKITLMLDKIDYDHGDHGNWADAKFLTYDPYIPIPDPEITITASDSVQSGQDFTTQIALSNVTETAYQAELTVNYDTSLFEFVKCEAADDNVIVKEVNDDDEQGTVNIVVEFSEPVTTEDISSVDITFKAKQITETKSGTIEVSRALIKTTEDDEIEAEPVSKTVEVKPEQKPFTIEAFALERIVSIKAAARILPTGVDHPGEEAVLFQLMKDTTPISIVAIEKDIISDEVFAAYFNVNDYEDPAYKVRVFVFDRFDNDVSAPLNLATPAELK